MTDSPELVQDFSGNAERRVHARHRVKSLAYVELGENNGGIVLNIGEGGFAVRAAEAMTEDRLPRLRFQMRNSTTQLVTSGEIAWSSDSRKEAGVRFIDLPEDALLEIKTWISQETSPVNFQKLGPSNARLSLRTNSAAGESTGRRFPGDEVVHIRDSGDAGDDDSNSSVVREPKSERSAFSPPPQSAPERKRYSSTLFVTSADRALGSPLSHGSPVPPAIKDSIAEPPVNWLDFRIQVGSGWVAMALVVFLAAISFAGGMMVRRGERAGFWGSPQDRAPVQNEGPIANPPSPTTPPKDWQIEIVDSSNRRWSIPASVGVVRSGENAPGVLEGRRRESAENPAIDSTDAPASKKISPVLLSLPESSLSASQSVAISSQRSFSVPADSSGGSSQPGKNLHVGQLVNLVEPVYPSDAEQKHIEGTVKLHATIGTDGSIKELAPLSGPPPLIPAALIAVREWRYNPTLLNGQPIETQEDISLVFRLPK